MSLRKRWLVHPSVLLVLLVVLLLLVLLVLPALLLLLVGRVWLNMSREELTTC